MLTRVRAVHFGTRSIIRLSIFVMAIAVLPALILISGCESETGIKSSRGPSPESAFPQDKVSAYLVVPNFDLLCEHLEALVNTFTPGLHKPGEAKEDLGMMLGDPGLASVETGKPAVAVLLAVDPKAPIGPPQYAFLIPVKDSKPLENFLAQMGMPSKLTDNVLVAATDADALTRAAAFVPGYKDMAGKIAWKHDLHLRANLAALNETYGRVAQSMLAMGEMMMTQGMANSPMSGAGADPKAFGKLVHLYIRGIIGMLNQSKTLELRLALDPQAIRFDYDFAAKEGTVLAKFLAAPGKQKQVLGGFCTPDSAVGFYYRMDPAQMQGAAEALLAEVRTEPEFQPYVAECERFIKSWTEVYGGEYAMTMGAGAGPGKLFALSGAWSIADPDKAMKVMEDWIGAFGPDGTMGKMYANMGMPMRGALVKNVRTEDGIAVHRIQMGIDTSAMPPAQQEIYNKMLQAYEIAIVDKVAVIAADAESLNPLIARAKKAEAGVKPSLHAAKKFGTERDLYMDIDFIGLARLAMASVPSEFPESFKGFGPSQPMLWAASFGDGRTQGDVELPLQPFVELSKVFPGMRGAPPPPPPAPPPPKMQPTKR